MWPDAVERLTGERPRMCPWRAFYEPLVIETMHAYRWFESGQLAIMLGADPPALLVEAIGIYHGALNHVWAQDQKAAQQARRSK